jgi:uncharacterized membrane protein
MTCPTPASFACGPSFADSQFQPTNPGRPDRAELTPSVASNPLERLAQLVNANDRLMDELTTSRARIVAARAYLDRPGCNARFGSAHLERSRGRHSGILAQLRANRIEALRLLGEGGSDTRSGS